MLVGPGDVLGLREGGLWEPFETELVRSLVSSGQVVVDAGAHIGYYTLLLAGLVGPSGRVAAFEPEPQNFRVLQRNVAINGLGNVELYRAALSERVGWVRLYLSESNSGDNRIFPSGRRPFRMVRALTLDSWFERTGRPVNFLKLDVQGAELLVLKGAEGLLRASPRLGILFEFWPYGLSRVSGDPMDLPRFLEERGFTLLHPDEARRRLVPADLGAILAWCPPDREDAYTNLLALRGASLGSAW